jgi:hypothetical protein
MTKKHHHGSNDETQSTTQPETKQPRESENKQVTVKPTPAKLDDFAGNKTDKPTEQDK